VLNPKIMNAILLFLSNLGMTEILVIGLFVLIFFGAKKIPDFMKGLGKGVREFKDAMNNVKSEIENPTPNKDNKIEGN
jgi:sec-independent protein translocase protein TatA